MGSKPWRIPCHPSLRAPPQGRGEQNKTYRRTQRRIFHETAMDAAWKILPSACRRMSCGRPRCAGGRLGQDDRAGCMEANHVILSGGCRQRLYQHRRDRSGTRREGSAMRRPWRSFPAPAGTPRAVAPGARAAGVVRMTGRGAWGRSTSWRIIECRGHSWHSRIRAVFVDGRVR